VDTLVFFCRNTNGLVQVRSGQLGTGRTCKAMHFPTPEQRVSRSFFCRLCPPNGKKCWEHGLDLSRSHDLLDRGNIQLAPPKHQPLLPLTSGSCCEAGCFTCSNSLFPTQGSLVCSTYRRGLGIAASVQGVGCYCVPTGIKNVALCQKKVINEILLNRKTCAYPSTAPL